jgi:Flp pilus assembly pilin Flp
MHQGFFRWIRRLHEDERGKLTVEWILLIAFITLPLLALLIVFRNKVADALGDAWNKVFGEGQKEPRPL